MKAYYISNCRIKGGASWDGYVIAADDKSVSEAIKEKFGLTSLYCEMFPNHTLKEHGMPQFHSQEVPIEGINIGDLTVSEFSYLLREIMSKKS